MSFCISIEAAVSIIESYNMRRDMHFKNVSCKIMLPSVQRSLGFLYVPNWYYFPDKVIEDKLCTDSI